MNLDSPEIKLVCELVLGSSSFQPDDINVLISGFEAREEDLIRIFDAVLRFRKNTSQNELNKLDKFYKQIQMHEAERQRRENETILNYESSKLNNELKSK